MLLMEIKKIMKKDVNGKSLNTITKVESVNLPPPFPKRKRKNKEEAFFHKFIDLLKRVHINLSHINVLQDVQKYAKYIKEIMKSKNWLIGFAIVALTEECISSN